MIGAGPTRRAGARESKERKQARTHPSPSPRRPRLSKIASPQTPEVDNAFGNRIKNFLTKTQLYLFARSFASLLPSTFTLLVHGTRSDK
jgi:hypothetical protein